MKQQEPKNIVERLQQTLKGTAWAHETFRGKKRLSSYNFPRPERNFEGSTDIKLYDFVTKKVNGGETHSRGWAELNWARRIAVGLHIISGFETPDKAYMKKVFAARKQLENIRKGTNNYWNDPGYIQALENYNKVWKAKFSSETQPQEIIQKMVQVQDSLLKEFSNAAVANQLVDHRSLFRLEPVIKSFMNKLNDGVDEPNLFDRKDADFHQDELYNLMLEEKYGANLQSGELLARRMLEEHISEIQSYADTKSHTRSNKKELHCDIDLSAHVSDGFINVDDSRAKPLVKKFYDRAGKISPWSVVIKHKVFDSKRTSLNAQIKLVGREEANSYITLKPDFDQWLEMLPHSPVGTEASLSTDQARQAYENELDASEKLRIQGQEENKLRREKALEKQAIEDAKRAKVVKQLVEDNYDRPLLTKENAKGTQIEKKQIMEILDFEELHGLLRVSSLYDVPAVSIQMGLDTENTRGLQYLANPPYTWGSKDKEDRTNKMFDVMNDDMKNCFIQLGDVGPNTTIIPGEGFSTMASLYIAAKRRNLDVVCVASMFVDNIKHAVEHYKASYPDNPMLNGADNDSWTKGADKEVRAVKDNAGLRTGLILHDLYGIESFSPDWSKLGAYDKALSVGACDFNDMFEVFGYEPALELMGDQLEHMINTYKTPAKELVGKQVFAEAEHGTYESIFDVYGIDPELKTADFITHSGQARDYGSLGTEIESPNVDSQNVESQVTTDSSPSNQNDSLFQLQRFQNESWEMIDSAESPKDILLKQELEKRYAIEGSYSDLLKSETEPTVAFNKALHYAESSFRCFDTNSNAPFTSVDTFNDIHDVLIEQDVVLFIENENGYVRPIRKDENGDLIIGGTKDNVQPRFNSRLQVANAIDAILNELEFSEVKAFDMATEESFKLRTVAENNKPLRETDRSFNDEFGVDAQDALKLSLTKEMIDVKVLDQADFIEVTCNTTSLDNPTLVKKIDKNELGYELDALQANSSIIDIDSGIHDAEALNLNIEAESNSRALFVLKSYAPNGAPNGQYYLKSQKELDDKVQMLQYANFIIPTTVFQSSNGGLTPLETSHTDLKTDLLPAHSLNIDQKVDASVEVKKYIATINEHSVQHATPSNIPTEANEQRVLKDGIWFDGNNVTPVGNLEIEHTQPKVQFSEIEMAENLNYASTNNIGDSLPSGLDLEDVYPMSSGVDVELELEREINEFRAIELAQSADHDQFSFNEDTQNLEHSDISSLDGSSSISSATHLYEYEEQTPILDEELADLGESDIEVQEENKSNSLARAILAESNNTSTYEEQIASISDIDADTVVDSELEETEAALEDSKEALGGVNLDQDYDLTPEEMEALYRDLSLEDVPVDEFMDEGFELDDFEVDFDQEVDTELTAESEPIAEQQTSSVDHTPDTSTEPEAETEINNSSSFFDKAKTLAKNSIETVQSLKPSKETESHALQTEAVAITHEEEVSTSNIDGQPVEPAEPTLNDVVESITEKQASHLDNTLGTSSEPEAGSENSKSSSLINKAKTLAKNSIETVQSLKPSKESESHVLLNEGATATQDEVHTTGINDLDELEEAHTTNEGHLKQVNSDQNGHDHVSTISDNAKTSDLTVSNQPEGIQNSQVNGEKLTSQQQDDVALDSGNLGLDDIVSDVIESVNPESYGTFVMDGDWALHRTVVNEGSTQIVIADSLSVGNNLPDPAVIETTEVSAPTPLQLDKILQNSKLKAWSNKKTRSSILSQVSDIEALTASPLDTQATEQTPEAISQSTDREESFLESPEYSMNEVLHDTSPNEKPTQLPESDTEVTSNVVKALETLSQIITSGELNNSEMANILKKFSAVNSSVDPISDADIDNLNRNIVENDKTQNEVTNQARMVSNSDLEVPQPSKFASEQEINDFWDFEFPSSSDVSEYIDRAKEEVGDKGHSALVKKSTFLTAAGENPNAKFNELAQHAIDVQCHLQEPTDELTKQEYASKAAEVANWLTSIAKPGLLIESQRDLGTGRLPTYQKLDKSLQRKVQESLVQPINQIKALSSHDYVDFICIKDAIEKRQIPEETLRQVLFGAYNSMINKSTGVHGERYKDKNSKVNASLSKVIKKLCDSNQLTESTSEPKTYHYEDPVDGSEGTIKFSDLKVKLAGELAKRDVEAGIEMPRQVKMKKVGRESFEVVSGRVIEDATGIQSPVFERREPQNSYTPVGRGAQKAAMATIPQGVDM